jgi:PAS domain S-box-containing protein
VPANVVQPRTAGLAILNTDLQPMVATPGLLDIATTYGSVARRVLADPPDRKAELMLDPQGQPVIVVAAPINTVPGAGTAGDEGAIGVVLGVRSAEEELFPLLAGGPAFAEDSETLLLGRRADGTVALLSPTRDGSPALRRTIPADRVEVAESAAVAKPGSFAALSNYRGSEVLQVSRPIRNQNWVVAQQVDAVQALSLADERRRFLVTALSLLLLSVVAVAVAAWRHGSSVRAQHHASELADKAARLERQTGLLHTITDSLDVLTILVTRDDRVLFTNQAVADEVGLVIPDILGRSLAGILSSAAATELQEGIERMRREGGTGHRLLQWPGARAPREFHASFIPVERIGEERDLTLLVLSDVTDLRDMQKRHGDLLRRLVATLVAAVDRRDPHAAHHAQRMTEVTEAVARELGFGEREREALGLAASLANIGKIMVPPEILTKRPSR